MLKRQSFVVCPQTLNAMTKRAAGELAAAVNEASKSAKIASHTLASGRLVATVTELDESGNVTMRNTVSYIKYLREQQNCNGAFMCGTSGEAMSLTLEERKVLTKGWFDARACAGLSSDTFAIVVNVGSECLKDAQELAALCEQLGADAIAVMAPTFNKPKNAVEVVDFLADVASAAPNTPLMYYHFPDKTNCSVLAHSVVQEAWSSPRRLPTFAGMKFSSADMSDYGYVCDMDAGHKLVLLNGFEMSLLAYMTNHANRGSMGFVGVSANVLGHVATRILDLAGLHNKAAVSQDDMQTAIKLQGLLRTFMKRAGEFGWIQATKHCLVLSGVIQNDRIRAPLKQLTDEQRSIIANKIFPLTKKGV